MLEGGDKSGLEPAANMTGLFFKRIGGKCMRCLCSRRCLHNLALIWVRSGLVLVVVPLGNKESGRLCVSLMSELKGTSCSV